MAKELNNKQLWVLAYLRENPSSTVNDVAQNSPIDEVKTAQYKEEGREWEPRTMHYSDAYVVMMQLLRKGLVTRELSVDGFGDQRPPFRWAVVEGESDADDPLEKAFAAPSAEVDH
jgi:hypothetical protein